MKEPHTVHVPEPYRETFAKVEAVVVDYFRHRESDPERGIQQIFGERYVLVRAPALSVEFFALVRDLFGPAREAEADDFARNILFDLAHAVGRSDARRFHERMKLTDPIERLAAGPVHFAHTGWAFVRILPESKPDPEDYCLVYDHPYSFEADAWLASGRTPSFPVCIMSAGYSSGWCGESFGIGVVASEISCRARGDEECRFIMAEPEKLEGLVESHVQKDKPRTPHRIPDFFARKRMEEELRQARDTLEVRVEERTAALREANVRLLGEIARRERVEQTLRQQQKLEAIGRLAGGIAHDFNNLMGIVIGQASLAEKRCRKGETLTTHLHEIRTAAQRAADLTEKLLTFSRAQDLSRESVELNAAVTEAGNMLQRLIGDDIVLHIETSPREVFVTIDRAQMTQVLLNLAVNARDAMPKGGRLSIAIAEVEGPSPEGAFPEGRWALLTVIDEGTGMDDATRSKIFEPFFTTKEAGHGTGLGLSTVYGIVTQGGGHITVDSAVGEGAQFQIFLPPTGAPTADGKPACQKEDPSGGAETLLVAEDEAALRRFIVDGLTMLGYRVIEGKTPKTALDRARAHEGPIPLLITDVVMPEMNGRELAEAVSKERTETRTLYISGYTEDKTLRYGVAEGHYDLLRKPFTLNELGHAVRRVLDRA